MALTEHKTNAQAAKIATERGLPIKIEARHLAARLWMGNNNAALESIDRIREQLFVLEDELQKTITQKEERKQ